MALYDENGNVVEGALTKEEFEAAVAKAKADAETAAAAAKVEPPVENKPLETAALPETVVAQLEQMKQQLRMRDVRDAARKFAGSDPEKQKLFIENFERVTGYEGTPEGVEQQAQAVARLIGLDTAGVPVGDMAGAGSGRNVDNAGTVKVAEVDKGLGQLFNISDEDRAKYAPQGKFQDVTVKES